jgi:hypothetical protein
MRQVRFAEGPHETGNAVFEDMMLVLEMCVNDDLVTWQSPLRAATLAASRAEHSRKHDTMGYKCLSERSDVRSPRVRHKSSFQV